MPQQQRIGFGIGDDAAGGGDDCRLVLGEEPLQRAALVTAERRGARHFDEVGDAGAVILRDAAVELDERPAEMLRQHAPERGLAGATQADESNAPRPVGAGALGDARRNFLGERGQLARRHLRQQIEDRAKLGSARTGLGQQRGSGKVERLGDGAQHAHRRIAGAALDLRQIALRSF